MATQPFERPRVLLVGGMPFNVPPELRVCDLEHITQERKRLKGILTGIRAVVVYKKFVGHSMSDRIQECYGRQKPPPLIIEVDSLNDAVIKLREWGIIHDGLLPKKRGKPSFQSLFRQLEVRVRQLERENKDWVDECERLTKRLDDVKRIVSGA